MRFFFLFIFVLICSRSTWSQCETASVPLPDASQPVVNPAQSYCVSFTIDPSITGHPIGVSMNIQHSWQGDLSIRVHACGNTLMLMTRPGGGSCNAGSPFGNSASINGNFSFYDTGTNPDLGLPFGGGSFGLSSDPCGVNTVNSFAALGAACGNSPYTLEVCITDHAFGDSGFASSITPLFAIDPKCGCTDPLASNYDPTANVDDGSCIYAPCTITASVSTTPDYCGQSNGSATVSASGGSGSYIYNWGPNPGQSTTNINNLPAGSYSITITDSNSSTCQQIVSFTIAPNNGFAAGYQATQPGCIPNGQIQINTSGSVGPFGYFWSHDPGFSGSLATGLSSGLYEITITDANTGCEQILVVQLNEPNEFFAGYQLLDINCTTGLGGISTYTTGGSGNFSYSWSHQPGYNQSQATNLTPGNYSITINDQTTGCTFILEDILVEGLIPIELSPDSEATTCGLNNGTVSIEVTSGTGPFNFSWSSPLISGQFGTGIPAGTYTVTVTDMSNGCTQTSSIQVADSDELDINALIIHTTCGDLNGGLEITVQNGSGQYAINWLTHPALQGFFHYNLAPGVYEVEVEDLIVGCSQWAEFIVNESYPFDLFLDSEATICGADNGSVTVYPSITGNFSYQWSHMANNTSTTTGLSPGTYTVTVTNNSDGCTAEGSVEIADSELLTISHTKTDSQCGLANGSIDLSMDNGSGFYQFQWNHDPFLNDSNATGLAGGISYEVLITDALTGCTAETSVVIEASTPIQVVIDVTDIICGPDDGAIQVTPVFGGPGYQYAWLDFPGNTSNMLQNIPAGIYSLQITDPFTGCQLLELIEVEDNDLFEIFCNNTIDESTVGAEDGAVQIEAFYGQPPFNIQISGTGGQINLTIFEYFTWIDGLSVGQWNVFVTDANGCIGECSFYINPGDCGLELEVIQINLPTCTSDTDGSIEVTTINETGVVLYSWPDAPLNLDQPVATDLGGGSYTVIAIDENGCQDQLVVVVDDPVPVEVMCEVIADESVFGEMDGMAAVNLLTGELPFTITLIKGQDTILQSLVLSFQYIIENLSSGNYVVEISDAKGCTTVCNFNIQPGDCAIGLQLQEINHPKCPDTSTGSILISANGPEEDYVINWSPELPGNTGFTAAGLSAGIYTVELSDTLGCYETMTIELVDPEPLILLCQIIRHESEPLAADGSLSVTPQGLTAPFHLLIRYQGNVITNTLLQGQLEFTLNNLIPGTYEIRVTDANDCIQRCEIIILPGACKFSIDLVSVDHPICYNDASGEIVLQTENETGIVTWSVMRNSQTFTSNPPIMDNLEWGEYAIFATDAYGCRDSLIISLDNPLPISITCSPTGESFPGEADGQVLISYEDALNPVLIRINRGGNVLEFESDTGYIQVNDLATGAYQVLVIDANGCEANCQFIIVPANCDLEITDLLVQPPLCHEGSDGSITTNITGAQGDVRFEWSGPAGVPQDNVLSGIMAGQYQITVKDSLGCEVSEWIGVSQPPPINFSSEMSHPSCGEENGQVVLTPTGGTGSLLVQWVDSVTGNTLNNAGSGFHTFIIEDNNGCRIQDSVLLIMQNIPEIIITDKLDNICYGNSEGSITIEIESTIPIISINWSNNIQGELTISQLESGLYFVTVVDENQCIAVSEIEITQPDQLDAQAQLQDPGCIENDGGIVLDIQGGTFPYIVNGDSGPEYEFYSLSPGVYSFEIQDANGCQADRSFVLVRPEIPEANAGEYQAITCHVEMVQIGDESEYEPENYIYEWKRLTDGLSVGDKSHLWVSKPGEFELTVISRENGCMDSDTVVVVLESLPIEFVGIHSLNITCHGFHDGSIIIDTIEGGTAPYTIIINDQPAEFWTLDSLSPGVYNIEVKDQFGCPWPVETIVIQEPAPLTLQLQEVVKSIRGETIIIRPEISVSGDIYVRWENEDGVICDPCNQLSLYVVPDRTQYFTVSIETEGGCVVSGSILVEVFRPRRIFVPNAFSPNGDGNNDYFQIFGEDETAWAISMEIYDRWGNRLFFLKKDEMVPGTAIYWDGNFRNQAIQPDTYVYVIEVEYSDGHQETLYGEVQLLK